MEVASALSGRHRRPHARSNQSARTIEMKPKWNWKETETLLWKDWNPTERETHTAQQIGPLPIHNRNSVPAGCRNPAVAQRRSDRWSCFGPQTVSHMRFSANGPNVRHSFSAIGILILPYATMATLTHIPHRPTHTPHPLPYPSNRHFSFTFVSRYKCPLHSVEPQNSTIVNVH